MCSLDVCVTLLLKLLSLTMDGLTGVFQDHMRTRFQTSAYHMMLNINLWSTLVLGLGGSPPAVFSIKQAWGGVVAVFVGRFPFASSD